MKGSVETESIGRRERDLAPIPQEALVREIHSLMSEKLLLEVESPDTDLLKAGILDSLTLVQLLLHLKEHFGLKLSIDELEIDDLRSVRSIALTIAHQSVAARA